jgi:hypothetical protein
MSLAQDAIQIVGHAALQDPEIRPVLQQAALPRKFGAIKDHWHAIAERRRDDRAAMNVVKTIWSSDETTTVASQ